MGAEYDPRAPWNEKEPVMVKCEACDGKGKHWYAYDISANRETECTETTWNPAGDGRIGGSVKKPLHERRG